MDWKDPSPAEMVQKITSKLQKGSIILIHNGATNTPDELMDFDTFKANIENTIS